MTWKERRQYPLYNGFGRREGGDNSVKFEEFFGLKERSLCLCL
ncbi:hypothetical protein GXM_00804 [Nostoc sphaeroides CCNUC1]|uniref:Uncharacterized protein n=1 Tax=Nostoc sphaeroides CCNUC1 TaxID=2653204 RepID=A0A5P8VSN6_9NOSO|nr:hypothetical protein GXM_00804 [Nostoc sphaeroides CCNUC1]